MKFDCYKLKIDLPLYNGQLIKKDSILYEDIKDHTIKTKNNIILPSYINIHDTSTFECIQIESTYKVGDIIEYKFLNNKETAEIIEINNPFTVIVKDDNLYSTNENNVKISDIIKTVHKYYYITSGGQIQSTIEGKDFLADIFRKRIGNYFSSKVEAQHYRKTLLDKKNYEQQ